MKERPREQEAVKTTIVGGRPPGSGKPVGPIPRGIEVLVKKAAVDIEFKQVLLKRRARAADEIDLKLEPSEVAMINAVPESQLETIIARTIVHPRQRPAFLGRVAAVMIVALGASYPGCGSRDEPSTDEGMRPDRPERDEAGEVQPSDVMEAAGETSEAVATDSGDDKVLGATFGDTGRWRTEPGEAESVDDAKSDGLLRPIIWTGISPDRPEGDHPDNSDSAEQEAEESGGEE